MSAERFDVVVVGGGIHGTGVAQAAAAAGYSVLLLEKSALAAGTSSKSSKLIHGGLRYLESWEFGLVAECLRERALLLKLAPGLVKLQPFLIPIYDTTRRSRWLVRTGLSLYALLARFGEGATFRSLPRAQWDSLDGLRTDGLRAVFRYQDAQTDDRALTRAVMRSACELGARLQAPAEFVAARLRDDCVEIEYEAHGRVSQCSAQVLVNAAGPWVNDVLARVEPAPAPHPIMLVQGSHLELGMQFEQGNYYVESPRDGRAVFVMPRGAQTLVGTTEVRFKGDADAVRVLPTERQYLVGVVEHYFPQLRDKVAAAITDAWAGLRVLPAGEGHAFHRSRETILQVDGTPPRMLTIYGGKLTAYRATAEKVVHRIAPFLPRRQRRAVTSELPLSAPADG